METSLKANEDLSRRLEEVLKQVEDDREKDATTLAKAQNEGRLLQRSNDVLRLDLLKGNEKNKDLVKDRDTLLNKKEGFLADLEKLTVENKFLGEEICNERLLGFDQGIAQCH